MSPNPMTPKQQRLLADVALLIVTAIWGATFVMVDIAVETVSVFVFLAFRFSIAFIILGGIFGYFIWKNSITWKELGKGALVGVFLFSGYAFQTFGLELGTNPGKAAFITGLSVVFVPIFASILLKKVPPLLSWIGFLVAVVGLGLLSIEQNLIPQISDLLVLICAFMFAAHIVAIDRFIKTIDFRKLSIIQIGITMILSWVATVLFFNDSFPIIFSREVLFAMFFTGVLATAVVFVVQTIAQKYTPSTHVALIFAMEPVFGALFAVLFSDTMLSWQQWLGAGLIFISMIYQQFIDIRLVRKTIQQESEKKERKTKQVKKEEKNAAKNDTEKH